MSAHGHTDAFAEANKEFFNKFANEYEDLAIARDRAKGIGLAARGVFDFDAERTIAMEFASGTGLVTRELVPYVKQIIGVDISSGSIDKFNDNAKKLGLPVEKIRGVCAELKGEKGELDDLKFDIILCAQAYHHFQSIDDITRILGYFLRPGGKLVIFDYMHHHDAANVKEEEIIVGRAEDALEMLRGHEIPHIVPHLHGIPEGDMRKATEGAGLVEFSFKYSFTTFAHNGNKQQFFVVTATKPGDAN